MITINTIEELKKKIYSLKTTEKTIGFVPTMGALHDGHISLIKKSNEITDFTICSIFVNPTQFDNESDLKLYPSTIEEDKIKLEEVNCDVLFLPESNDIYKEKFLLKFNFGDLESVMEGAHRTGHFNGVALVVSKLFNIVDPNIAFFGQKDYQQLAIIKKLVKDLSFDIKIVSCPTLREKNGLAMSSRNKRLSKEERIEASKIYQSLKLAKELIEQNQSLDYIKSTILEIYNNSNLTLEYFEIVNSTDLQPIKKISSNHKLVICVAAFLGKVRLIDNIII